MHLRYWALLIAMAAATSLRGVHAAEPHPDAGVNAPPQAPPALNANTNAGYLIEFLGREPADDWAKSARVLERAGVVPLAQLQLGEGDDPCSALLEKLNFRSFKLKLGCSAEVIKLIGELNPALGPRPPVGATLVYPDLPVQEMSWFAGFDLSQRTQVDNYKKITEAWKPFRIKQTPRSISQVQVEFRGFQAKIAPNSSPEAQQALKSIRSYDPTLDRYVTRVLPLSNMPLVDKKYSITDPVGWGKLCLDNPNDPPTPPAPPYISLLGGKKEDLECISNCTKGDTSCPEIVFIDQKVAPHPDIAAALGTEAPISMKPKWCPFIAFDEKKHHGTHMAGIMVSSGGNGFLGLSPGSSVDNRDGAQLSAQDIVNLVKEKSDSTRPEIFVFASEFLTTDALIDSNDRYHTPPYVEDILNSQRLWVVAAGQGSTDASRGNEIGTLTRKSPMNLGDRATVLVITACENCYEQQSKIAAWANYSGMKVGGLVNIAAPGGSAGKEIPAPVTENNDGLAHGTSQATALVGGLAAAMVSCYPTVFNNSRLLKNRLLITARPPVAADVADKVSVGVVDAGMALHSPHFHWVTLKAGDGVEQKFKEIRWCTERVNVRDLTADTDAAPRTVDVDVRTIRRIVRDNSVVGAWYIFYADGRVRVGRMIKEPDKLDPLLYFAQGPGKAEPPIPLDEIDNLLVGFPPNATVQIPKNLVGCK
jgi:hypothetical protein